MIERLEAQGYTEGEQKWDDGSDHDDVTKISVKADSKGIYYIRFDYIKSGQPEYGTFHGVTAQGSTQTFEIDHLKDEQLESVEGYYEPNTGFIQGLQFKTNLRISELIGNARNSTKFSLAVDGKKIIGFHGSCGTQGQSDEKLRSIGAYFTWIAPTRMEAKGVAGGKMWNDGADHEGVTKIYVRGGLEGIQYIKFDYIKDGQQINGPPHGVRRSGFTEMFEINHLDNEYLVSVEGYYDDGQSGFIQGVHFKTNIKTSGLMGYEKGKKFSLAANGKKIIGFHGYSEKNLNSLGAYFTSSSPFIKLECIGDLSRGLIWDDGAYEGIRKVYISESLGDKSWTLGSMSGCVRFDYDNAGKVKMLEHGLLRGLEKEFEVDYPNEFITSVEATVYTDSNYKRITSLTFKTSTGRTSLQFGSTNGDKVVLESKGCALVGFHGQMGNGTLWALGAYFRPLPPAPDAGKLEGKGGDGGASWDDGVFDDVKKIYIGIGELGSVAFVKFMYETGSLLVLGDDHGSKTILGIGFNEFELDGMDEYLISVEGCYEVVNGVKSEVIIMLKFKTNKRTSPTFGLETGSSFILEKENHKIVGFHGKASTTLHQIGVHVLPIT